jgi:hypothetical protein
MLTIVMCSVAVTFFSPVFLKKDINGMEPGQRSRCCDYFTGWKFQCLNPGRGKSFSSLQSVQTGCGAQMFSYLLGPGVFPRG